MYPALIKDHMIRFPYVTSPDQSISEAMDYMRELGVRHLPVMGDSILAGIVSERDLKAALNLENAERLTVGEVMHKKVYVVPQSTPLYEVADEMAAGKIGSAVVINDEGDVAGIFTTTDALRLLATRLEDEIAADLISFVEEDDYEDLKLTADRNY